jgi:hypothetical protein
VRPSLTVIGVGQLLVCSDDGEAVDVAVMPNFQARLVRRSGRSGPPGAAGDSSSASGKPKPPTHIAADVPSIALFQGTTCVRKSNQQGVLAR